MITIVHRTVFVMLLFCFVPAICHSQEQIRVHGRWKRDFKLNQQLAETKDARELAARLEKKKVDYFWDISKDGKCANTIWRGKVELSRFPGTWKIKKQNESTVHLEAKILDPNGFVTLNLVISKDGLLKVLGKNSKCVEVYTRHLDTKL